VLVGGGGGGTGKKKKTEEAGTTKPTARGGDALGPRSGMQKRELESNDSSDRKTPRKDKGAQAWV